MSERLFVYGTLAPGRPNAHVLADVAGTWHGAVVRGTLYAEGWGAAVGFPGLVPDPGGDEVAGWVLESDALAAHWERLDAFEGEGYRRTLVPITRDDGVHAEAHVYALREHAAPSSR